METRYPAGAPIAETGLPDPDGTLDTELLGQQAEIRRRRSLLEPPSAVGMTPRIVPRNLMRAALADDVRTNAEALAIRHGALDTGFNVELDSVRERLSGFSNASDLVTTSQQVIDPSRVNVDYLKFRTLRAQAEMRRSLGTPNEIWTPPPPGTPLEPGFDDSALTHYGVVAANAQASYRGEPLAAPGDLPLIIGNTFGELWRTGSDIMQVGRLAVSPLAFFTQSPGDSVAALTRSAQALGSAFNGKAFWRGVWVNGGAGIAATVTATTGVGWGNYDRYAEDAGQRFDEYWDELPRPAQLFVDEFNPGNVGLALAGGPLASVLRGAGTRGALIMAGLVDSLAANPVRAVGLAVGSGVATRGAYEATEGAPEPARIGAALGAGGGVVGVEAGLRRVGFTSLSSIRSALGEGGAIKAGSPDEMLESTTGAVLGAWRNDTQLNVRLFPTITPRPNRAAGGKLTVIPDVLPAPRPANTRNVTAIGPSGGPNMAQLQTASHRAADLSGQTGNVVPSGVMHNVQRGDAEFLGLDEGAWRFVNGAPASPSVRSAIVAAHHAQTETATRVLPSRAQFIGRIREMFGDTDRLPEHIEYVGPSMRPQYLDSTTGLPHEVPAIELPETGTIRDFFENPTYYSEPLDSFIPEFAAYDARNSAVSKMLETEFGRPVGEFDTGIASAATGGRGIFFPTYDAGIGRVAYGFEQPPVSGKSFSERTYPTLAARRLESSDPNFTPVTDIGEMFARLDGQKIAAAQAETFRYGVGGSLTPVDGWKEVPVLEALGGRKTWLPPEEADAVAQYLTQSESGVANFFQQLKGVRLNADTSPLTIGGSIGWAVTPAQTALSMVKGIARGNPFRAFTDTALYQDIAAAPERWVPFFTHMDMVPNGGTPAEWRSGFIEKIPGIGKGVGNLNDGAMNVILRGMEGDFDEMTQTLVRHGLPLDAARAEAANQTKMAWLQSNVIELGAGRERRSIERAVPVSPTYIRQPVNFQAHAAAGFLKLMFAPQRTWGTAAQWSRLDAREVLAAHRFAKMAGTFTAIAATTAVITAEARGYSPADAIQRAVFDTDGPDWLVAQLGGGIKLPLGGPHRALIRALGPGKIEGVGDDVPFAGLAQWAQSRVNPNVMAALRATGGLGIQPGVDFQGNLISPADGALGVAQSLLYAANQTVPIMAGVPYEAWRQGRTAVQAGVEAVFQFFGQTPQQEVGRQLWEREQRLGARVLYAMPDEAKTAAGLSPEQQEASRGAPSLTALRNAVGSRAASKLTALVNPDVPAARAAYVEDLRRRADSGDRDAEALIVSVDTEERLTALAQQIAAGGELDRVAYREARGPLISEMVGQSQAFRDVFEGYRKSDSPIDRLSSDWYALFDKATPRQIVNGREVATGVDWETFSKLEEQFFAGLDPKTAVLVQQNVAVAPLGAGPAEEELRVVRADLTRTGYWEIEDGLWQKWRPALAKGAEAEGVPQEVRDTLARAGTFAEFSMGIRQYLEKQLVTRGYPVQVAPQVAKSVFSSLAEVRGFDRDMQTLKRQWAEQNAESGLAIRAQAWGYLSDSAVNLNASGAMPTSPTAKPAAGAEPAEPPPTRVPRRQPINFDTLPLNEKLLVEHENGLSYGQIAIKYDLTRDAVIGRIKRMDESPELLAQFVRDEDGRIVSMERAPLRIVRDASGRPVGIGRSLA